MEEKRRSKRLDAHLELNISSLFKQNNVLVSNINSPITINNISRNGIGFTSASVLPEGFYFNAALTLGSVEDVLYCVVKIVRSSAIEDSDEYSYGCEFVGLPGILMYIFDEFEAEHDK